MSMWSTIEYFRDSIHRFSHPRPGVITQNPTDHLGTRGTPIAEMPTRGIDQIVTGIGFMQVYAFPHNW